jgi:hypothetical protein
MSPGAHLSHAARSAFDAQRVLLAAVIHLEMADAAIADLDLWLTSVDLTDIDIAILLHQLGDLAQSLQRLADEYGHAEVARRTSGSWRASA